LYSESDEAYYASDEIVEKNGKKFSTFSGSAVEWVEEDSFFFKLSSWEKKLLEFYDKNEKFIVPISRRNEVINFVKSGLKDLSISRTSFTWGIKVPNNDKHVIYVWLDALTNYLSALNFPVTKDKLYKSFWPASLHVIGKDILRFHAIYWPAFLLAANIDPPKRVFSHGWILSGDEKMSKSKGNILNPLEIINTYGIDQLRYYLMKEVSHGADGNISLKNLENCINSDLANNLGNLLNRTMSMIKRYHDQIIPEPNSRDEDPELKNEFQMGTETVQKLYDDLAYNKILERIWLLVDATNKYIDTNSPWNLMKSESGKQRLATVMYNTAECIRSISILIYPFMPKSAETMMEQLGIETSIEEQGLESLKTWGGIKSGIKIRPGLQLFPRIDDEDAEKILNSVEPPNDKDQKQSSLTEIEGICDQVLIDDFMKVDLRTGKIIEAENIKKSKKLLKLKVDIGTEVRQVVAGIAECYEPDQLINRTIILVANLKPVKLMGVESQGMLLAANNNGQVVLAGFDPTPKQGIRVR